jgi:hypothetical protein
LNAKVLTNNKDLLDWLTVNLGWTLRDQNNDALVVVPQWESRWEDAQQVTIAQWNKIPVYRVSRTSEGFMLEHVDISERTLALLHTAHANGYTVRPA